MNFIVTTLFVELADNPKPHSTLYTTAPVNETATLPALLANPYAPAEDEFLYAIYHNAVSGKYNSFPTVTTTELNVTEGFETYAVGVSPDADGQKPTGWTVVTQYEPYARSK